ncbi:MAG: ANTAR domain-containing protein [Clostridia bacterium]|nr:ANTAR domain-containing protein [Clostridia bacterium]
MDYAKFILFGNDKKTLSVIKNSLVSNGHIFLGYSNDTHNILKHVRSCYPEFVVIEITNKFTEIRNTLEVLDEELLTACVLVFETRNDEILNFLRNSRIITYLTKPVFDEAVIQIADLTLMNYKRVMEYEQKVKKLNDTIVSRKVVEKAKWILVEKEGYTESEAYEAIKKKSRDNRIAMKEIAEAIILARN